MYDVDKLFDGNIIVPETVKPLLQVTNPEHVKVDESVSPVVDIEPNVWAAVHVFDEDNNDDGAK